MADGMEPLRPLLIRILHKKKHSQSLNKKARITEKRMGEAINYGVGKEAYKEVTRLPKHETPSHWLPQGSEPVQVTALPHACCNCCRASTAFTQAP
jgi:hypothetical protein